jgi:hypothetical protein
MLSQSARDWWVMWRNQMHISNIVVSVALLAFSALPSFAADSMMAGASM